ncbi:MAG: Lrp/AsnC family transcriptional regulator [Candidatus Micrarchaeota archaeon]|nr:Lrp/AsnC family transcriptional regulator [Candidatus Micrarchaeota archaeon]
MKEYSYLKKMLLRELGENSRVSVTNLAKKLKCSRSTVISNLKSLEKELGLSYTVEFNKGALGLEQRHMWRVKFGKKPTLQEINDIFKNDEMVQFVALTEGDFDLFLDIVVESGDAYAEWAVSTAAKLLPFKPELFPSMIAFSHTGFIPVPNDVLEHINIKTSKLDALDIRILTLLNANSRRSYRQIARELKEHVETVRYRMRRLGEMDLIRRYSTVMIKPPKDYLVLFFVNYKLSPGIMGRAAEAQHYYESADGSLPIVNKFQYLSLVSGSDILFGFGCFENEEEAIKDVVVAHKNIYNEDEPTIHFAAIKNVIKGQLAIRNIDIAKDFRPLRSAVGKKQL